MWEEAVEGMLAIATVLKVLHLRAKILGLYAHNERNCPHARVLSSPGERLVAFLVVSGHCGVS